MWLFKDEPEELPPDNKLPKDLSAKKFVESQKAHVVDWDFWGDKYSVYRLNRGDVIFSFKTSVGDQLGKAEKHIVNKVVNLSSFDDEVKLNNVPHLDVYDDKEASQYTIIITKLSYLLPDVPLDVLTPMAMSNSDYHRRCQPGSPTIWDDVTGEHTFRMTKKVIPYVFNITLQLKASEITNKDELKSVHELDPRKTYPVDKALLMERTKRNTSVIDATRKAKSLLLYTKVEGGLLVQHYTVVCNSSIPALAVPVLNNFSSFGASEGLDTAKLTRVAFKHYAKDDYKFLKIPQDRPKDVTGRKRVDSGY